MIEPKVFSQSELDSERQAEQLFCKYGYTVMPDRTNMAELVEALRAREQRERLPFWEWLGGVITGQKKKLVRIEGERYQRW